MISFDKEQGIASDIGDIWRGESEDPIEVRVTFEITDDDELSIGWVEPGEESTRLYVPIERLKRLLADDTLGTGQ